MSWELTRHRHVDRSHLLFGLQIHLQLLDCLVKFCLLRFDDRCLTAHALQLRHLGNKKETLVTVWGNKPLYVLYCQKSDTLYVCVSMCPVITRLCSLSASS